MSRAVHWVGWALVESMTLVVLSLITLLVTARLLGPADFGIAASVIAIIGVLNTAVEGLFSEALVQRATIHDGHVSAALGAALASALVLILLCWVGAGFLAALYHQPMMAPLLRVGSLGLLFSGFSGVQSALLRRSFGFRQLALRTLVARVSSCVIALAMTIDGWGPWSLIGQYLAATGLGAVALWWWSPQSLRWHHRPGSLRDLWRFAGPWLANEIVQVNLSRLYQALAAYLFGPYQFGFLSMGFRIADTLRDLIGNIANNVGLPVFARLQHDPYGLARQYTAATATLCIIALPCFAGLAICAPTIVQAVLGHDWLPSVPLIQVLAAGAGIGFTASLAYTVFAALGRPAFVLPLSLFEVVLSLSLLLTLSHIGIMAAGLAWALRQVISVVMLQLMCVRVLPLRIADVLRALRSPALLVIGFAAALQLLNVWILPDLEPIVRLAILGLMAGTLLIIGIALIRPSIVKAVIANITSAKQAEPVSISD
ncbi:MAG TPA: lipopolysaccharide biosynthesis protein [Rhodopila sp.]|nr:lipopolysaccharide biosynthesis protein [Rhodopila sp.]